MERKKDIFDFVYESFANRYRTLVSDVIEWYPSGRREITVVLRNGRRLTYNSSLNTLRVIFGTEHDPEILNDENDMQYRETFSRRFRRQLAATNLTQEDVAERSGVSQPMLSRYLQCKSEPTLCKIRKLAKVLGCTVSELVDDYELAKEGICDEELND